MPISRARPQKTQPRRRVAVLDSDGFKISLARGKDGLWRFDRDTVERIPAMNRLALTRFATCKRSAAPASATNTPTPSAHPTPLPDRHHRP